MRYYYFVRNHVKVFEYEINLKLNPAYTELTDEQRAFYIDHPQATVAEVRRCKLEPTYEPTMPSLEQVKNDAKNSLSQKSLDTLGKYVKSYQLANAQSSLYVLEHNEGEAIYDEVRSREIIDTYTNVGRALRKIYKDAENEIDACEEVSMVAEVQQRYDIIYSEYEYNK